MAKRAIEIRNSKGKFKSKDDFFEKLGLKPHLVIEIEDKIVCSEIKENHKKKDPETVQKNYSSMINRE